MAGFGSLIPDSGAAFGTQSPGEEGARTPSGLDAIIANIINGTLAIPKRAIDASTSDVQQLQDTGQFGRSAVAPATDTAMTMMGASAPFALARPGATAGIFGGRLAQTADHTKLARAEEMAASEREDARMNAADAAEAAADTTPTVAAPDFMNMKSMQPRKRPGWDD